MTIKYIMTKLVKKMTINNNYIIIEDGYNTSYISNLLISLFYPNTSLYYSFLENNDNIDLNKNLLDVYFQEIIKNKLIDPFRKKQSIGSEIINEIRNYLFYSDWKDISLIHNENNLLDLYKYLLDIFNSTKIEVTNLNDNIVKLDYIELIINELDNETNIKNLINDWLKKNQYKLSNIPPIICLKINRQTDIDNSEIMNIITKLSNTEYLVDIQKKIKLENNYNDDTLRWSIQSIICRDSTNKEKYYSYINREDTWYYLNDNEIPSFYEVNIKQEEIMKDIKKNSYTIFYKLDI